MLLVLSRPFALLEAAPARCGQRPPARMSGSPADPTDREEQARVQAALVTAMARGDRDALARLYDSLGGPLYSLAVQIVRDPGDAQDIVQDIFLQLWQTAATYNTSRGTVFGWAATLTRNRAIDRVRMRKRRSELLAESAPELQPAASAGADDSAASLWIREKAGAVRTALGQLAPEQRSAIELAFFSGLTQLEIAARLNEPLGTVKARIRRGLLKLRDILPTRL